jgi:HPt (histidine-containing phosphotransfer) domain-containing protein
MSAEEITDLPPGLAEFIPGYLAGRKDELKEMIGLLAAHDFENLAVLGHNIKGSGTSFGFPEISRIGAALQDSAGQKDAVATGIQLKELGEYLDKVELAGAGGLRQHSSTEFSRQLLEA